MKKKQVKHDVLNTKCRCYINLKYYAKSVSKGGNMKGYKPCPIHDK
jgi:hypothetical protein